MGLKVIFFGTPDFATHILKVMIEAGIEIPVVVTMPDKPAGRGHKLQPSSVKSYALTQGLEILQPESLKDPLFLEQLRSYGADLFVVVAFRMMPREVWAMPPRGTFNLHASLLPKYRGAAPIQHAILNGEKESGVTTFFLNEQIDAGQIILRRSLPLSSKETGGSLHDRLMLLGGDTVLETLRLIDTNTEVATLAQDNDAQPLAPKIFKEDRLLQCREHDATTVERRVRAMAPYPTALMRWQMQSGEVLEVKIFEATCYEEQAISLAPGAVALHQGHLLVGCRSGILELLVLQMPSKKAIEARQFVNGFDPSLIDYAF